MPAGLIGVPERICWTQLASASRSVFPTTVSVVDAFRATCGRGSVPTTFTSGGRRRHDAGTDPPIDHCSTAFWAQPLKSAVTTLLPTPGTTMTRDCGKRLATARAL